MTKPARLRTFWWTVHRWIGLVLTVLLVPIAVSGALLVWHDPLDALVHPAVANLGAKARSRKGSSGQPISG